MHAQLPSSPAIFRFGTPGQPRPAAFPLGLGARGVHEVCEGGFGDLAALTGFAMSAAEARRGVITWVSQTNLRLDHGGLSEIGLRALKADPPGLLHIETRKPSDTLWAVEEAIQSKAAGLVVAEVPAMDFTASRRLTLASSRHGVPAILLMPYTREGATASAARWRISPRPSAPNRYDSRAPGNPRWQAILERSRQAPHMAGQSFDLELDNETLSLTVVSGLATDTAAPVTLPGEDAAGLRRTG